MLTEDEFQIHLHKHVGSTDKLGRSTVRWSFEFDGKTIILTTRQLTDQRSFRLKTAHVIERLPPRKDRSNFDRWVGRLMEESVVVNENAAPA